MSRCFPFPPPGYEGKPRSEHKDLLKKEKHKVKKHKKERTDGGKREGKEKDRDHRKYKHNKKHKREKHEYRRKWKERDTEKREIWEQGTHKNDNLDNRRPKQDNKMPRTSPANHLRVNGETLKHSQGTAPSSKLPVDTNLCEVDMLQDNKECCNNGITGPHYLEEHKSSVSSTSYGRNEVSLIPPHPDTKYLSQVYSIPAVNEYPEYIDQDWLFSGDRAHQKSTVLEAAEPPQVWAEAQSIDHADVVAMPYAFPL